jgi:hypothetical protein
MRKWCVVCALTYLGEASKIWEVRRKSAGSPQEVSRNFFSAVTQTVVPVNFLGEITVEFFVMSR